MIRKYVKYPFIAIIFTFVAFSIPANAQTNSLSGDVKSAVGGELVPGTVVQIKQLKLTTITNENGHYEFLQIPAGTYSVLSHADGFADQIDTVKVSGATTHDFLLNLQSVNAQVVVTATGEEESVFESFSSVNSVGPTRIAERASTGLGEVLENEAGVSKRSFGGPGSSRPSIRGFEGDRVVVLQDGARTGSVGAGSGDHGEPISAFNLERLEVIKGPATLLYGSSAVGGVINAITDDKADQHDGFHAYLTAVGGTVSKQIGGAGGLSYGKHGYLGKLDLNRVNESDFKTPLGAIPNSASTVSGGSGNFGYFNDLWYLRGGLNLDRRRYGIPYTALFENRELLSIVNGVDCTNPANDCQFNVNAIKAAFQDKLPPIPDENVDIKMRQNSYRFWGGFDQSSKAIEGGNFNLEYTDYQHREIGTANGIDTVATTFDNDVLTYRTILKQQKYKKLDGQFGIDGFRRSYITQGAEQLIDGRVRQNNFAAFTLQSLDYDRVSFQFGGRIESNNYKPENPVLKDRNFAGFSGAFGIKFKVWNGGALVANFSTSYRPPALEELYNFGPHIGTITYEKGNVDLKRERTNGYEFSVRHDSGRVRVNGSVFYNGIKDFIYLAPQDSDANGQIDVEDGLPIGRYTQNNARFVGADGTLEIDIHPMVTTYVIADIVDAKLTNSDTYLPRITPARIRFGFDFKKGGFSIRPEILAVGSRPASKVFPLETPTDGYALFNVNGVYAFATAKLTHIFTFGAENITNKLYRNHVNFLKDLVPERGRGLKFSYTLRFL